MRATGPFLVTAIFSITLAACGGGNGKSKQVQPPDPPAAPVVTVDADIKQLIFSWEAVAAATYYRLLENPDGHSGFTQVGENIPSAEASVSIDIAVHLHDWVNAQYIVEACDGAGCSSSDVVVVAHAMTDAIGYFKGANTDAEDHFGSAIALSGNGDTLAIGAYNEDSHHAGINPPYGSTSGHGYGAVYVFRYSELSWQQQAYIKASNVSLGTPKFTFGASVAISEDGDTLAVGAPYEHGTSCGINGDQLALGGSGNASGAVYVFRFDGSSWYQEAYIKASNCERLDRFSGVALSADGNTLAVTASGEDSSASGINGDATDNSFADSGAVYIFRFEGGEWSEQAYIKSSNSNAGDYFGSGITLSADGRSLAVGAWGEDSNASGINGNQFDNSAAESGAVYVFQSDGTEWTQQAYIKASNTEAGDLFARVALSGDGTALAIGASGEGSSATGINGDQSDNSRENAGAVYLFRQDGGDWAQHSYIKTSEINSGSYFGNDVKLTSIGNGLAIDTGAGVDYWALNDSEWIHVSYLEAPDSLALLFGSSFALSSDGRILAVGAQWEEQCAVGINSIPSGRWCPKAGAVYVY